MNIDVANESGVEVDETALLSLAEHVIQQLRVHPLAELSVLLVDVDAMTTLHEQWMDEPGPTDVLAFPMDDLRPGRDGQEDPDGGTLLGDVVLCPRVAADQATARGHDTAYELHMLCTHGILHLLGYDHEEPGEEQEMFGLQAQLLDAWGAAYGGEESETPR